MKKYFLLGFFVVAFVSIIIVGQGNPVSLILEDNLKRYYGKPIYIENKLTKEDSVSMIYFLKENKIKYILTNDTDYFDVRKKNSCLLYISSEGRFIKKYLFSIGTDDLHAKHKVYYVLDFFIFKIPIWERIPFRS